MTYNREMPHIPLDEGVNSEQEILLCLCLVDGGCIFKYPLHPGFVFCFSSTREQYTKLSTSAIWWIKTFNSERHEYDTYESL